MPATLTPDLLAHIAAVRDAAGEPDDADLLVLADKLDEAANDQPTEYEDCPKCGGVGEVRGWLVDPPCPKCGGNGTVPKPNPLRDRAELIRVQVELGRLLGGNERFHRSLSEYGLTNKGKRRHPAIASLLAREHELTARNPAWLSVPCPGCGGSGEVMWSSEDGGSPPLRCPLCVRGDLLKNAKPTIARGFVTVTLPSTLCWREVYGDHGNGRHVYFYEPHPVLAAVLDSPVGPWVRRVVVSDRAPVNEYPHQSGDPTLGGWGWRDEGLENGPENVPSVLFKGDVALIHDTAEAAVDALARAVPLWVRRCP